MLAFRPIVLALLPLWMTTAHAASPVPNSGSVVPVIRLWLDAPVDEVARLSTYRLPSEFLQGEPGKEAVRTPHVLAIEEPGFPLHFNVHGVVPALATRISYFMRLSQQDPPSFIQSVAVYPLPGYVTLGAALSKAAELRKDLLAQGFKEHVRSVKERFDAEWASAPPGAEGFAGLETAFLSSRFFAKSGSAFLMTKGRNLVNLRVVNGRRKWGSRYDRTDIPYLPVQDRMHREIQHMDQQALRDEAVYMLEFSVGPTDEWQPVRRLLRKAELKPE